jgi:BASS family bile acid:Na+ symporter
VAKYPKAAAIGLVNQMILLPVVAFFLIGLFPISPELAVGMMVLAACPGGVTSNLITHLCKGDIALSISLTAITSCLVLITIPLIVNFSMEHFMGAGEFIKLPVMQTIGQIFGVTLVPVGLGMLVRSKKPSVAAKADRPVRIFSTVIFVVIVLAAVLKERENLVAHFVMAGPVALSLNLATMALGFGAASIFKLNLPERISIMIESGIQNGTLGIMVTATLLQNSAMTVAPALYSLIMFLTGFVLIFYFGRRKVGA